MDSVVLAQLIESVGIFLTSLVSLGGIYLVSKKLMKCKSDTRKEITLLEDLIYYKTLIELYKDKVEEHEGTNFYIKLGAKARELSGIDVSYRSKPSNIKQRLEILNSQNEKLEKTIGKLKI
jgi:hypothetical protein